MSRGIARRTVLKAAGGGVAFGLLGPSLLGSTGCAPDVSLVDACVARVREVDAARIVGDAYLRTLGPEPPSAETLAAEMAGEEGAEWRRLAAAGGSGLGEAILARHAADLEQGRLLEVWGWQLSATELRLAALVALRES